MPDARHGGYHPIRVINNTCTIVLNLLYGEDGLQKETRLLANRLRLQLGE